MHSHEKIDSVTSMLSFQVCVGSTKDMRASRSGRAWNLEPCPVLLPLSRLGHSKIDFRAPSRAPLWPYLSQSETCGVRSTYHDTSNFEEESR